MFGGADLEQELILESDALSFLSVRQGERNPAKMLHDKPE
jgi:hypothetical protein